MKRLSFSSLYAPLLAALLALLAQYLDAWLPLAYVREAILSGEWWRLMWGGWVHHNSAHLWMNLIAMILIWHLFSPILSGFRWLLFMILEVTVVDLCLLLFMPSTLNYWGLSGALHGLFVFCCLLGWQRGESHAKWWFCGLLVKLVFDFTREDAVTAQLIGARVHVESHIIGTITGIGLALFIMLIARAKQQSDAGKLE